MIKKRTVKDVRPYASNGAKRIDDDEGYECQTISDNNKHQVNPVSIGSPTHSSYQAEEHDTNRSFSHW